MEASRYLTASKAASTLFAVPHAIRPDHGDEDDDEKCIRFQEASRSNGMRMWSGMGFDGLADLRIYFSAFCTGARKAKIELMGPVEK